MTANLRFEDDLGASHEIYEKNWNSGSDESRDIPNNHHIVGVYGSIQQGNFITYLGFITANMS